ncbi:MAG: ABC-2 type transporter [Candidatus Argoarchaeum ethanivorans]|uniref:ABC-2 type transporter n=1 Tax=Candidatus Argoarchaeum ethanivorans TaxID=2608793 RepID=A0A811T2F6_9EURY|nr:MAG: ABC-2 type transporter [Candidatus Argoarchaeum ethanivorans]CAD6494870.1 MAG: ABC-2 type transporter [Candidatus Argoarchaeum ethanivorans]
MDAMLSFQTVYTMWLREMLRFKRAKSRIVGSLATPLFFLIILGTAMGSSYNIENYKEFMAPGIIAMVLLFSSIFGGISVMWDREFGFLKEILIAPVNRFCIALGKAFGGVTTAMIQGVLLMIITNGFGVHYKSLFGMLLSIPIMFIIGIGFISLGIALATKIESHEGFQMVMSFLTMPLVLLSGAFFPLSKLPDWLRIAVHLNPLTYGVEALRFTLIGESEIPIVVCLVVLTSFAITTTAIGGWLFGRMEV